MKVNAKMKNHQPILLGPTGDLNGLFCPSPSHGEFAGLFSKNPNAQGSPPPPLSGEGLVVFGMCAAGIDQCIICITVSFFPSSQTQAI